MNKQLEAFSFNPKQNLLNVSEAGKWLVAVTSNELCFFYD